jgi:hypothetical protein
MVSAAWRKQYLARFIIISPFRRDSLSNDEWYFEGSGNPGNRIEHMLKQLRVLQLLEVN